MIQDLADKVWGNPRFQKTAKAIEKAWLINELKLSSSRDIPESAAGRAMSACAILACSTVLAHRTAALRLSTYIFDMFASSSLPFDSALRVVLGRLGNFPAFNTRGSVNTALPTLPWTLAAEELASSDRQSVKIGDRSEVLTNFQYLLWRDLISRKSVAFSAPTSGGKSFVLELYLASQFDAGARSVAYVVPTRALITQVSAELTALFKNHSRIPPEVITVPLRAGIAIPEQAIYVMTQERLHLSLQAHLDFKVDIIVVDEAHSISEGARGILLHGIIDEMLLRNTDAQVLFASPTTKNLEAFGRLFQRSNISEQPSEEPTVSQNFLITKASSADRSTISITAARDTGRVSDLGDISTEFRMRTRVEKLAHIPLVLCKGQPNLIYANGADEAEDIAIQLLKKIDVSKPNSRLQALAKLARESVHPKYVLADCVLGGVAFHYGNMPAKLRQEIELAFAKGDLTYLVCTSTLLQGVNLPAKNIFMFKPTRGQGRPLESADFWNLAGRAGRLRKEFQGNIFLINYSEWSRQSLRGAKSTNIAPAIEKSITDSFDELLNIIGGRGGGGPKGKRVELETAFIRLFVDLKSSKLGETLDRLTLNRGQKDSIRIALEQARDAITVPVEILKRTHSVSAHRQQELYERLRERIANAPDETEALIPAHPSDDQSFASYARILELCHEVILGIDTTRGRHRFHALLARRWMRGDSIPYIISDQIKRARKREKSPDIRKIIRDTLKTIEEVIRFETIRLFGCYSAILTYALSEQGRAISPNEIPDVELFLEIGASSPTMVSLISLGLSRTVAVRLYGARSEHDPELGQVEALRWLQSQSDKLEALGLSQLQINEVTELLLNLRSKAQ